MSDIPKTGALRHLPNILSACRIAAALALLIIYDAGSELRVYVCVVLSILIMVSDFFDGKLARKYSLESKVGYVLDGFADRTVHVSVFLLFVINGILNPIIAWLLISRDICVYALRLVQTEWHEEMPRFEETFNKIYVAVVQISLFVELLREAVMSEPAPATYIIVLNIILCGITIISYALIGPRFLRACIA